MSYGPAPWQQTQWDWRAAGNIICGGGGAGLILLTPLCAARGSSLALFELCGAALIGMGLTFVWFELGRPLRALNVFVNPRTSWMTREAFVAVLALPVTLAAALGVPGMAWLAALLALAFVYCQGRMLQAAKGIPVWRAPLTAALIVVTGMADGAGWLMLLYATLPGSSPPPLVPQVVAGAVLLARAWAATAHRRSVARQAAPQALAALDGAGRVVRWVGTAAPLAALLLAALGGGAAQLALAGALAAGAGAWFKFTLIARAGLNQGFGLLHLPVRGAAR